MASNLTIPGTHDLAAWVEQIKLIDTDEPVVGGIDGVSNAQPIQLAKRTQWLKAVIGQVVAAAESVDPATANLDQLLEAINAIIAEALAAGLPADMLRRAVNTPDLAAGYYTTPLALEIVGGVVTPTYIDRNVMTLAVTESITLAAPEIVPAGGGARIIATIDATGNRALTLASAYRVIDGEFDSEAGAVNILDLVFGGPDGVIDVQISQRGEA
ncbi:hypothetical protein KL86APRO_40051 [uncultured Alphaproteobacteria bacterium]|uniref:Uncharacterized protein n=1 Tax=uncultured Alphaproteobacteria bacterium TaxID=91750 RepID=A0A212KMY1_9PROT|nr:hypothetical protein KL86APRO_40051 [uncultured Alphaproteobacteria bacterium]